MTALADRIDRMVSGIGRVAAWLILVVVLLQFALVVARYLFGLGSIWLSETVIYAHAGVFMLVLLWLSVPYAARSWAILERSQEASGLPLVFALKTLIPVFAVLMALQGVAQAIRAAMVLARTR